MLQLAIILFVIAACFGLYVLIHVLTNRPTPKPAVFTHGGFAALALLIVLYSAYAVPNALLVTSAVIFVLAALGGLTMFYYDMTNKPIPKVIAIIHPLVAVIALLLLIVYVLTMSSV